MNDFRGIRIFAIVALLLLGVVLSLPAKAQSPPMCGFLACEAKRASLPNCVAGIVVDCKCQVMPTNSNLIELKSCWLPGTPSYPNCSQVSVHGLCNCASKPDKPGGNMFTKPGGRICDAGCQFVPKPGPNVGQGNPFDGTYSYTAEAGWRADGTQCNPLDPDQPPDTPVPSPVFCDPVTEVCAIEPLTDPPNVPELCSTSQGVVECAKSPECKGSPETGYLCVDSRPPGPPEGPSPTKPPDFQWDCEINGVMCEVKYWKPPFNQPPCPPGSTRSDSGVCVQDDVKCPDGTNAVNGKCPAPIQTCPDGTKPQNGKCPAPLADCADGTRPVNGACEAPLADCPDGSRPQGGLCPPQGGVCPNGTLPGQTGLCPAYPGMCANGTPAVNGQCTATYAPCSNGSQPVNGMCTGTPGMCPNGSQPVNGMCGVGECDPVTDPGQCTGNDDGHASGGGTCAAPPACSGDVILCMQVQQQWDTRCAVERLAGDGSLPTEADHGPTTPASSVWAPEGEGEGATLDASGWLGGGGMNPSCPAMPTVEFMSMTMDVGDIIPCSALRILSILILLGGYAQAAYIIGRA